MHQGREDKITGTVLPVMAIPALLQKSVSRIHGQEQ
jgi:hypothetical protein